MIHKLTLFSPQAIPPCPDVFIQSSFPLDKSDEATIPVQSPSGVWPLTTTVDFNPEDDPNNRSGWATKMLESPLNIEAHLENFVHHVNSRISRLCTGSFDFLFLSPPSLQLRPSINNNNRRGRRRGVSPPDMPTSIAWHSKKPLLAAIDSTGGVQIFNFDGRISLLGHQAINDTALNPKTVLRHQLATCSNVLAWRPYNGMCLAVGCKHGVCLWDRVSSSSPHPIWLHAPPLSANFDTINTICWHPKGHLLAGASTEGRAGLFIWDIATGGVTSLRSGLTERLSMLRWSPCGAYLFAKVSNSGHKGGDGSRFRIWETVHWTSASWTTPDGSTTTMSIRGAEWSPDGRTLLLIHSQSASAVHFTADPPSLTAQVLPVVLDGLQFGPRGGEGDALQIDTAAWDAKGQRLALGLSVADSGSLGTNTTSTHVPNALVALYDTKCDPILTTRCIGIARMVPMHSASDWEIVDGVYDDRSTTETCNNHERMMKENDVSDALKVKTALTFMPGFSQGAVLSVRQGDFIGTLPMYFTSV